MIFKHYRELVRPAAAKEWFAIEPKTQARLMALAALEASETVTAHSLPHLVPDGKIQAAERGQRADGREAPAARGPLPCLFVTSQ